MRTNEATLILFLGEPPRLAVVLFGLFFLSLTFFLIYDYNSLIYYLNIHNIHRHTDYEAAGLESGSESSIFFLLRIPMSHDDGKKCSPKREFTADSFN